MSKKIHFRNLDSIRSIAFFSTFLAHAFYTESLAVESSQAFQWAIKFRIIFSFGVQVFFVLSGFLITYLMLQEQENSEGFNLKNFYVRRVLRIWPVYFSVLIFGFLLFPLLHTLILQKPYEETASGWMYAFFLSNFDQIQNHQLPYGVGLGPTWSVSVEEQFYLIWPFFILLFKRNKFIIPVVIVMLISIIISTTFHLSPQNTIYCMLYLSVGGLFAYLSFYYEVWIKKIAAVSPLFFILSAAGIFVAIYYSLLTTTFSFLFITITAFLIGYVIVYQCYGERFELKSIPFIERWGKYTYGLYLYHVICNFIIHILIEDILHVPESVFTAIILKPVLSLGLCLWLSYMSYHYMESFFLRLKENYNRT